MTRRSVRKVACAGVLAAALCVASPVQAADWGSFVVETGFISRTWSWIAGFWEPGGSTPARGRKGGGQEKTGAGVDPNGETTSSTTSIPSTPPPCQTDCERGSGIDPNG